MSSFNDIKDFLLKKFLKENFKIGTPNDASLASLTFGSGDSEIVFEAVSYGTHGNSISVSIINSEEVNSELSFSFDIISKDLIICPKKESDSITSLCSEVATILSEDASVSAYLSVTGGSGVIDPQAETNLSGGVNATEGIGKFTRYINGTNIYICLNDSDFSSTGKWREVGSSLNYGSIFDYEEILNYEEIL